MTQSCPLCQHTVPENPRYPRMVCGPCVEKAVDAQGRAVVITNTEFMGYGVGVTVRDTEEKLGHIDVWIDNTLCHPQEGRFGGIVVQPVDEKPSVQVGVLRRRS